MLKLNRQSSAAKKLFVMAMGASQMGFLVAGGLLLGLWVDRRLDSSPWLGMLGLVLGFAAGIRFLVRLVKLSQEEK